MIIIGEKINGSIPIVAEAIAKRDSEFIKARAKLDSSRQTYLLDSIHDIQTMITCTGLDDFISHRFHINKIFQVVNGSICE